MARGGEADIRHVEAGDDLHHAGELFGFGSIDSFHEAVGHGAVQHPGHQGAHRTQIGGVFGGAGDLVPGVHPDHAFADDVGVCHLGQTSFPNG